MLRKFSPITILEINKFRVWRKMITIYICIYVSLYESTEEQKCLVPCELLNDITIIACIIIIVNKTRNANAIQSCSYVNTKNFIFFISLWGITLSKIIGSFKSFKRGNWKFLIFNGHNNSILSISLINIRQSLMTVSFSL